MESDLKKEDLITSVKTLLETEAQHLHLDQPKLYTLFSIAFQYMLFRSSNIKGHYIIRIENSFLAAKLARKAKDISTRKFLTQLQLPRKLKYGGSYFHLDFFPIATWGLTKDLPHEKVQGALIVKDAAPPPPLGPEDVDEQILALPEDYYLSTLLDFVPKTITIAFEQSFEKLQPVRFPFIKDRDPGIGLKGVRIASDVDWKKT